MFFDYHPLPPRSYAATHSVTTMTLRARVVLLAFKPTRRPWSRPQHSEDEIDKGIFEFAQMPAAGDRFTIREFGGSEDDVRVLYIRHETIRDGEAGEPHIVVVAEWLTGRADPLPKAE
jgi:hypothetical protein